MSFESNRNTAMIDYAVSEDAFEFKAGFATSKSSCRMRCMVAPQIE